MSLSTKEFLLKQLSEFGLNPKEWQLITGKKWSNVKLINEEDSNLQLIGVLNSSKKGWQSLTLATRF